MQKLTRREMLSKSAQCAAGLAGFAAGAGCGGGGGAPSGMRGIATAFMKKYNCPGLSVAIARNQQIVYTNGFGVANPATGALVTPASQFRIASSSKPFTAVTCIRLINANMLQLDHKVFGAGGLLGSQYTDYDASTTPWLEQITVKHLLTHTGGGWFEINKAPSTFTDPVWQNPGLSQEAMIAYTLKIVPLQFQPGMVYGYSNFGYVLLGRIIAMVTGMTYSQAVYQHVLTACGITDMQLASDTPLSNEVTYVDPTEPTIPGSAVARIDAAGGWVATATDLVKFLIHVDAYPNSVGLVPTSDATVTLHTMTTAPGVTMGADPYGMGWMLYSSTQWGHNGGQNGVSSEIMRISDSGGNIYCLAIQVNTSDDGKLGDMEYLPTMNAMVAEVSAAQSFKL